MRLFLERSGGFAAFPGLQRDIAVDTAELSAPEAAQVESLVAGARVHDMPPLSLPARGAADMRTYRLTVEDRQSLVVEFSDPIDDDALAALVAELQRFGG